MENINQNIKNHYLKEELYEDILNRLKEQGIDLHEVKRSDIAGVDEFHVRGAAVSKELAESLNLRGATVLDVGCGLGGPCRMLADEYNCQVTGLDLSNEYIRTAKKLSKLVKLDSKTSFIQGDVMKKTLLILSMILPLSFVQSMQDEATSGENPFLLIARIQVKEGRVEDYLDIAETVDQITQAEEPGMLFHNFDQDPSDPLRFTWSEIYENSDALLVHFGASYAADYVAKSNELADSFEIEIYGNLSKEAEETVRSFGFPFKHFKTTRVGYSRDEILNNNRSRNISLAKEFLDTAFTDPERAKSLLHNDFSFQFMGICTLCTKEDADSFFNEFLPEVGRLIPKGIALDITDEIGDSNSVVLRVSGTAQGINGSYNNNYAMVYTFRDGKIIALNEYNSDLLAETRLYKKQVVPTN